MYCDIYQIFNLNNSGDSHYAHFTKKEIELREVNEFAQGHTVNDGAETEA
jgi:hypothetical protein